MSSKLAVIGLIFCALLIGAGLYSKSSRPSKGGGDPVSAVSDSASGTVSGSTAGDTSKSAESQNVSAKDAETQDPVVLIEEAARTENDAQLERFFEVPNLPATTKAKLITMALERQDARLMSKAEELLRSMVSQGTTADVLAAIPKVAFFPDKTLGEVAQLQSSLCRFQGSSVPQEELGFEMIKMKFNLVLGKEPGVRPWRTVCPSS